MRDREHDEPLRERRLRLGLTQQMLASIAEVSVSTIRNAEAGKPLRPAIKMRIERALKAGPLPAAGAHRNIRGLTDEDFERVIRGEKKNPDPRKGKARR